MGPPCLCKVVLIFLAMEPTKLIPLYAATALTTFLLHTWKSSSSCSRFLRNSFSAQDQRIAQRVNKERFFIHVGWWCWPPIHLPLLFPSHPCTPPNHQPTKCHQSVRNAFPWNGDSKTDPKQTQMDHGPFEFAFGGVHCFPMILQSRIGNSNYFDVCWFVGMEGWVEGGKKQERNNWATFLNQTCSWGVSCGEYGGQLGITEMLCFLIPFLAGLDINSFSPSNRIL